MKLHHMKMKLITSTGVIPLPQEAHFGANIL